MLTQAFSLEGGTLMPLYELTALTRTALPPLRLDHLRQLTDDTGLLQHAFHTTPDPHHGYTTDDNARALLVALQCQQVPDAEDTQDLASRYLAFLRYAQRPDGRFHNFLAYDRNWLDEFGSDDTQGRAIWSLGYVLANSGLPGMRLSAEALLEKCLPCAREINAPRGYAYSLLGLSWALHADYAPDLLLDLAQTFADRLLSLWKAVADDEWAWFEDIIAYCSPKLCEGLLHAYLMSERQEYADIALAGLDFLLDIYFSDDMLDLVGQNGWYRRGRRRAHFDQQPIDACAVVQGCLAAYQVTGEAIYFRRAYQAFSWFLGANRLGAPLYAPNNGGCFDGLHRDRVNGNQGAESTIAYLMARLAFEVPPMPASTNAILTADSVAAM